jgi:membrane-associated phospholipid phosphatase
LPFSFDYVIKLSLTFKRKSMTKNFFGIAMLFMLVMVFSPGCKKENDQTLPQEGTTIALNKLNGHLQQAKTFSSKGVITWINMQLNMLRLPLPSGTGGQATDRCQAYCGIALYEAVVNGMPAYRSLSGQLNGLTNMPSTEPGKAYHWAASANAALADMNRDLFPTTAQTNKTRMNFIEDSLNAIYATEVDAPTLSRSISFGKAVAAKVFAWALLDGFSNVNPAYVAPVGTGLWVPTSSTAAVNAYAFQRRYMVPGVVNGTALVPPPTYSTVPGSPYFEMVKEVYDISLVLTNEQKAMADYFKDNPGYGPGGGFVAILSQAFAITHPTLDWAALTYAKVGISQHEATIVLNTDKYIFNVMRPITYIRANINPTWNTYIGTPNHPEFPSGHATTNGAVLAMMINMFGDNFPMTLHTYDYLNYPSRAYATFTQMGLDMANSRLYGGLHYRATCEKSIVQGKKVAENILSTIKFLKD